jgi:hypothetical protein
MLRVDATVTHLRLRSLEYSERVNFEIRDARVDHEARRFANRETRMRLASGDLTMVQPSVTIARQSFSLYTFVSKHAAVLHNYRSITHHSSPIR